MAVPVLDRPIARDAESLSASREHALVERARAGEVEAREELLRAHGRLIGFFARKYANQGVPVEDLVQEGSMGLLAALDRFDPSRGVRFASYASWWIRRYQIQALHEQGDGLPLTPHQRAQQRSVTTAITALEHENGRTPTREEVVDVLGESHLSRVEQYARTRPLDDADPVDPAADALTDMLGTLASEDLRTALSLMPERNRSILMWRYGIDCPAVSLAVCGERMRVTAQRAQQIQKRALRYLRYAPEAAPIRAELASRGVDVDVEPR